MQILKEKISKFDFIIIQNFFASKGSIKTMERQFTKEKKIDKFANHLSNKELMARVCKLYLCEKILIFTQSND